MEVQTERAYQKQKGVQAGFHARAQKLAKKPGKAGQRYWKSVGLGFKTPREAINGEWTRAGGAVPLCSKPRE
jgi:small subunit ribosomal protein S11e